MQYFLCQNRSIQLKMWFSERIVSIHMTPKIFFHCWKVIWSLCDCRNCRFLSADAPDFWAIPLATFLAGRSPSLAGQDNISDGNFPVRNAKKSHFDSPCFPAFAFLTHKKDRRLLCWSLILHHKNSTRMNRKKLWSKKSKHLSLGLHKWREI